LHQKNFIFCPTDKKLPTDENSIVEKLQTKHSNIFFKFYFALGFYPLVVFQSVGKICL